MANMVKIIDGTGLIFGRLATRVAKMALAGEEIKIVNSEKVVISGSQETVLAKWKQRKGRTTPRWGPFISIMPDRILRRAIYGMLPHKIKTEKSRGIAAFKRIMCYVSVPEDLKNQKFETIKKANSAKLKTHYIALETLSKLLKG